MNARQLIEECQKAGVSIIVQGNAVSLEGDQSLVAHYAPQLRPYKAAIIAEASSLVREFMEVDGLSLQEAEQLALISAPRRTPDDWLSMISELDGLIDRYCEACGLSIEDRQRIHDARMRQSLASIPAALLWFRRSIAT